MFKLKVLEHNRWGFLFSSHKPEAVEKQNRHYKPYGFDLKEGTSRILLGKTHFVVKVCKSM